MQCQGVGLFGCGAFQKNVSLERFRCTQKGCTQNQKKGAHKANVSFGLESERYSDLLGFYAPLEPKKSQGLSLVKGSNHRKFIGGKYKVNTKKMQREKATGYKPDTNRIRPRTTPEPC